MSKSPHQKAPKGRPSHNAETITDPRFSNIHNDPRFRIPSRKNTHVKLDDRFAHMLRDDEFSRKSRVDKYGRKLVKDSGRNELERFYELGDQVDNDEELEEGNVDDDAEVLKELERVERKHDPARDGGFSSSGSSSSENEDSEDEEDEGLDLEEQVFGLSGTRTSQDSGIPMGEVSSRVAVVNLDWDNIRAVDLLAVFSSFCPPSGRIKKIAVYPSEFGKERMEREEMEGPPREIFLEKDEQEEEEEDSSSLSEAEDEDDEDERIKKSLVQEDKGDEFDSAKLRHYQLERLRYYYAVMSFSSPETAKTVYDATDGTEYLTTANFFDLRFVGDDVSFEDDSPRDECTSIPNGYKPNSFVTDALQHSKVRLTWDADDGVRKEAVKKAFTGSRADIEENDLKAYLGSDSSDDDEDPEPVTNGEKIEQPKLSKKEAERQRLRAALGLGDAPTRSSKSKSSGGPVGDMQITFSAGLSAKDKRGSVFEHEPDPEETTVEKYKRKEKERKQRHKERVKVVREETEDAPKKSAGAPLVEAGDGDLGFDDPFFTTGKDDPTTKSSTSTRKAERLAKREQRERDEAASAKQRAELELLMLEDDNDKQDPLSKSNTDKNGKALSHFNMNEILRAEKNKKYKKRRAQKGVDDAGDNDQQAGFEMNTVDPRFAAVYSNHEYAIDPTNPRFQPTKGMASLLEEGRKRRRGAGEDSPAEDERLDGRSARDEKTSKEKRRRKQGRAENSGDGDDVTELVQKVKRRHGKGQKH
ncbi:MAG: hypothetical protein M4579_004031 [Chaenotheca gracillima]|nr:MAG: hypothetical protein M4579_004031 [Chaenotheca gracillima]